MTRRIKTLQELKKQHSRDWRYPKSSTAMFVEGMDHLCGSPLSASGSSRIEIEGKYLLPDLTHIWIIEEWMTVPMEVEICNE